MQWLGVCQPTMTITAEITISFFKLLQTCLAVNLHSCNANTIINNKITLSNSDCIAKLKDELIRHLQQSNRKKSSWTYAVTESQYAGFWNKYLIKCVQFFSGSLTVTSHISFRTLRIFQWTITISLSSSGTADGFPSFFNLFFFVLVYKSQP